MALSSPTTGNSSGPMKLAEDKVGYPGSLPQSKRTVVGDSTS